MKRVIDIIIGLPLHPFIFAIYPILFLFAFNVQEVDIWRIFLPLVIAIASTLFLLLILTACLKDRIKAGFITTLFIFIFYTYGYVFDALYDWNLFTIKHRHLVPVILYIGCYLSYIIHLIKQQSLKENFNKILNIIATILFIINIIKIVPNEIKKIEFNASPIREFVAFNEKDVGEIEDYPDIYYIILDEYASLETIKKVWGYDNGDFAEFLRGKGFFVTEKSKTRSISTFASLANSFNMEYVTDNHKYEENIELFYNKFNDSKLVRYLKSKGYWMVAIGNIKNITGIDSIGPFADANLDVKFNGIGIFNDLIIRKTLLKPFMWSKYQPDNNIFREAKIYNLNMVKSIDTGLKRPMFVFLHVFCPHDPFVFGRNGEEIDVSHWYEWGGNYYRDQYIYITNEIKETVSTLLNRNKNAIIIIQSDHGPRAHHFNNSDVKYSQLKGEENKIFNAIYAPKIKTSIPDNISSVNAFRIIFNAYFDDKFEIFEN